jgi:hypothetical protein
MRLCKVWSLSLIALLICFCLYPLRKRFQPPPPWHGSAVSVFSLFCDVSASFALECQNWQFSKALVLNMELFCSEDRLHWIANDTFSST